MGICTTAEGVETVEQLEYLLREGCSVVQGYLFSKPRPGADIPKTVDDIGILSGGLTQKPVAA
jgi:EAL domain-containing protein (putative c-di-GMP-specific phosphodiesterase class I)